MYPISSSICRTSSIFNFSLLGVQLYLKIEVIVELNDSLRDLEIGKNNQKRLYDASVQATQQKDNIKKETTRHLEICYTSEIEKMRI